MTNKIQLPWLSLLGFNRSSLAGRFWTWWSGELGALVPKWLGESANSAANALLIEVDPEIIVLRRWLQGKLTELGRVDRQSGDRDAQDIAFKSVFTKLYQPGERVALWLSESQYLVKAIDLPLAAAENLRQVLVFEMDRHTPFKAEQVYFDFREQSRDNNRLTTMLALAPKQAVDDSLELLAAWGAPAQSVFIAGADNSAPDRTSIDLMTTERRIANPARLRWLSIGLPLLTLMLAIFAITIPIWQKRQAVIALMPIVERAKTQASATDALRRELEKLRAEYNFMLDKKQEIPPVLLLLDDLSRLLPDDTWVQQFNLKDKELQIQGETASSSKLIALIENAKFLHNANFRSPLTKGSTPNSERYDLAAEVRPLSVLAIASTVPPQQSPMPAASGAAAVAPAPAIQSPVPVVAETRQQPQQPPSAASIQSAPPVANTSVKSAEKAPPGSGGKP